MEADATGAGTTAGGGTRRVVWVSLVAAVAQTAALAIAGVVTGSSAIVSQTFATAADVAVQVFLVIGVYASVREADETHPLGYGRERYFWSLYAALAIFVGGFVVAIQESVESALHPEPVTSFTVGYVVLGATLVLDTVPFWIAAREIRHRAHARGSSMALYLRRTTEVATPTELIGSGLGVVGGLLALIALAVTQATGSMWPDPIASAAIGVALMLGAAALTQLNRSLLTGRGVPAKTLEQMRGVVEAQAGVVEVPDLFGIVVGPAMVAIDGDVTFADELDVPDVETAIGAIAGALRARWPEIRYVYLTPVGQRRDRHGALP